MRSARRVLCAALLALAACGCGDPLRERDTAELRALVDTMLPALARLASLPALEEVRLERRDSAAVRRYVEQQLDEELPRDELAAIHATYALLGLIPDTLDLRALMLQLYTEQIVGYYDPEARTLYVVDGVAPESVAPVLAHELVHALQDQHADLDSLIGRDRGNDRQTAAHAALEGHATIVMFAWLAEQAAERPVDPATLPNPAEELTAGLRAQNERFPVFQRAPLIIREALLFPYFAGTNFVYRLWQAEPVRRPAPLGEWLPESTEQVLQPEAHFLADRAPPAVLRLGPAAGAWQALGEDDGLGLFETSIFLEQHLGPGGRSLADGWAGDILRLLRTPGGQHALVWYSVWDDRAGADRFAAALARIAARQPAARVAVVRGEAGGQPAVRVVVSRADRGPAAADLPALCLDRGGSCVPFVDPRRNRASPH